ncbi:hypothetical protein B9Z55_005574 [Caenorhabditis nigoni]|uniref:Uncharacterized protein n=1 Tax=Caenorhabditis nigoni TaxID=1611254 RepID=A0A2G5V1H8_9PELO|nr:hypothetical protein B9Z55_005574 [Caenorhabditis nigoni]
MNWALGMGTGDNCLLGQRERDSVKDANYSAPQRDESHPSFVLERLFRSIFVKRCRHEKLEVSLRNQLPKNLEPAAWPRNQKPGKL